MYSRSNTLFVQCLNIITIALLYHCNFVSIVSCFLLKRALMIFGENMLVRESFSKFFVRTFISSFKKEVFKDMLFLIVRIF